MRKLMTVGAVVSLIASPAAAEAQAKSCLTDAEARALFTYAIPEAMEGVTKRCEASLPESAFLRTNGTETISKFRAAANSSWPSAKAAFMKIAGSGDDTKLLANMPDAALAPFVAAAFSGVVASDVKPADCPKIDRFVAALAPFPPSTVAELITALIALTGDKGSEDFKLC